LKFSTGVGQGGCLGRNVVKIENSRCQGLIFDEKITILPVDHHSGHKVGLIVFILGKNIAKRKDITIVTTEQVLFFILSEHVAMYDYMPYGLKLEIQNGCQEAV
jgi:hypothetical protein